MRRGRRRTIQNLLVLVFSTLGVASSAADLPTFESRALTGSRMDVAALLLAGGESGALWAAARAIPRPADGDTARVDFWVEIDGTSLLAAIPPVTPSDTEPAQRLRLELHVYAMTPDRQLAGSWSHRVRLPIDELRQPLATGGVRFAGHLNLPAGNLELRLLALVPTSQRFALRILQLTVPTPLPSRLAPSISAVPTPLAAVPTPLAPMPTRLAPSLLAPPLFADAETWIQVHEPGTPPLIGIPAIDHPAALPVLRAGTQHSVWFEDGFAALPNHGHLIPADAPAEASTGTTVELTITATDGTPHHLAQFDVPRIASGTYRFGVSNRLDVSKGDTAQGGQRVFIIGDDAQDAEDLQGIAWPSIRSLTVESTPAADSFEPQLELGDGQRGAQQVAKITDAYHDVLTRLTTHGVAQALDALCAMESQALATSEDRLRGRTWMESAQDRVIERLAATDPESLIPVLALHVKAHDRYVEQRDTDPFLPGASRNRILILAELYTRKATSAVGRNLAASALAEIGVAIDRSGMPTTSRRMLEESLALDPSQTSALLYLAYAHQRRANFEHAIPLLRQLLDVAPQSQQGKLRLAHSLAQQGEATEAARLLRQVLRDSNVDWMLTIAYQELASLLQAQQRYVEAARLLEAAVARLPSQQRLRIQLAYALDRIGEGHRGREVLANLPADRGQPSPRNFYSQRPQTAGSDGRSALQRHAMARLPLLAAALEQTAETR